MHALLMSETDWRKKYRKLPERVRDHHRGETAAIEQALHAVYDTPIIHERLDALSNLLGLIVSQLKAANTLPRYKKELVALYNQASKITGCILNETDHQEILKRLKEREEYKAINEKFMPWTQPITALDPRRDCAPDISRPKFNVQHILKNSKNRKENRAIGLSEHGRIKDDKFNLTYLTPEEREAHRLIPYQGKLVKLNEHGKADQRQLRVENFDTNLKKKANIRRIGIFVVSLEGDIFVGDKENGKFHHSSFLPKGSSVMFSGTLLCKEGKIDYMDNLSGHFQPKHRHVVQMRGYFRTKGILNDQMTFKIGAKHPHQLRRWGVCSFDELRLNYLTKTVKSQQTRLNRWSLLSTGGKLKAKVWHDLERRIELAKQSDEPITLEQILKDWKNASVLHDKNGRAIKNEAVLKTQRSLFACLRTSQSASMTKVAELTQLGAHNTPEVEMKIGKGIR